MRALIATVLREHPAAFASAVAGGAASGLFTAALLAEVDPARGTGDGRAFAAACAAMVAARLATELVLVRAVLGMVGRRRVELTSRLVAADPERVARLGSIRLVGALTEDANTVAAALPVLCLASLEASVVVLCLGSLAAREPALAATLLAVGSAAWLVLGLPLRRAEGAEAGARETRDPLEQRVEQLVWAARELKQDASVRERVERGLNQSAETHRRLAQAARVAFAARETLALAAALLTLTGIAAWGSSSALVTAVFLLVPVRRLVAFSRPLTRASGALARLDGLREALGSPRPSASPADAAPLRSIGLWEAEVARGALRLGPATVSVTPGELVFVTGGNGAGKTTLVRLWSGLLAPARGEALLNGLPASAEDRRERCTVVSAGDHLFADLHDRRVDCGHRAALLLARFELPGVGLVDGRWSTTALSQGQRKRLALVAALLEDRPALFLDEWAADQDPRFKSVFYRQLLPWIRASGRAVVVVTHDDEFFDCADRRIHLEDGRLIELPTLPVAHPGGPHESVESAP
ncbi:MAG: ATP-binding cassette domain-containing protein [Myxococcota bacterium]